VTSNTEDGSLGFAVVTVTVGARTCGADTKRDVGGVGGGGAVGVGRGGGVVSRAGFATTKDAAFRSRPRIGNVELTVTVSPGENGRAGRKLTPPPSECASNRPGCTPEREPVTTTVFVSSGVGPRNVI
jgi:hypothetical protein